MKSEKDVQESGVDKMVISAANKIYSRLWLSVEHQLDVSRAVNIHVGGTYKNSYSYPQDGWVVSKILFPDIAAKKGNGYHRVAIVASTAGTKAGVQEAINRSKKVSTKLELGTSAHITAETIIVLSNNISFKLANRLRRILSNGDCTVFIYSVKNAIGVARNAIKAFATLFDNRAKKILNLPGDISDAMQALGKALQERADFLFKGVAGFTKRLLDKILPKRAIRRAKRAAYLYLEKLRKVGLRLYIHNYEYDDLDAFYNRVNATAQYQGIDIDAVMEELAAGSAKQEMRRILPEQNAESAPMRSTPQSKSYMPSSNIPYMASNSGVY